MNCPDHILLLLCPLNATFQVYLEPTNPSDPTCGGTCGIDLPFMYYEGSIGCAQQANEEYKWVIVDYSIGRYTRDPTAKIECGQQI